MKYLDIFSTAIGKTKLNLSNEDKNNLLLYANKVKYLKSGSQKTEDRTLMSDDLYVLNLDKFKEIKKEILKCFYQYINLYKYENNFSITTSWITKSNPGNSGEYHKHMNCFISGVYYFKFPINSGHISFNKFNSENIQIIPKEWNRYNGYGHNELIEEDDIIFFPGNLYHTQLQNNSNDVRYSLAFNFMPKGKNGYRDSTFEY